MYQFNTYLNNISVLEKMFSGEKIETKSENIKQDKIEDNNLLIAQAKELGLKVPSKIVGDEK